MPRKPAKLKTENGNGATSGIENELWEAADKLRGYVEAAEYKFAALKLIFLKGRSGGLGQASRLDGFLWVR